MDSDVYSGLVGALLGSVVGAVVAFVAQRTQATRLIEHGTERYRQAAQTSGNARLRASSMSARRRAGTSAGPRPPPEPMR